MKYKILGKIIDASDLPSQENFDKISQAIYNAMELATVKVGMIHSDNPNELKTSYGIVEIQKEFKMLLGLVGIEVID